MKKIKDLTPYEKEIVNRIKRLISEYCDGSQKRFVDKTKLNKGSVSQYVNGKNIPSWENAEKIASAFKIDVNWLMAVDTLHHSDDTIVIPLGIEVNSSPKYDEQTQEFIHLFQQVSDEDRDTVMKILKNLQPRS